MNVNWKRIRDNIKRKFTALFIQAFTFANDILYHMNDGMLYILLRAIY